MSQLFLGKDKSNYKENALGSIVIGKKSLAIILLISIAYAKVINNSVQNKNKLALSFLTSTTEMRHCEERSNPET